MTERNYVEESEKKDYGFGTIAIKKTVKIELDEAKLIQEETYSNEIHRLILFYKENKDQVKV